MIHDLWIWQLIPPFTTCSTCEQGHCQGGGGGGCFLLVISPPYHALKRNKVNAGQQRCSKSSRSGRFQLGEHLLIQGKLWNFPCEETCSFCTYLPINELPNFPCEIYFCRKRKVSERGERGEGEWGTWTIFSRIAQRGAAKVLCLWFCSAATTARMIRILENNELT